MSYRPHLSFTLLLRRLEFLGLYSTLRIHPSLGRRSSVVNILMPISLLIMATIFNAYISSANTYATASTLELTISDSAVNVDIGTTSTTGTFKKSEVSTVTARTNNYTGYTLTIAAPQDTINPQDLKTTSGDTISSIESDTSEVDFSAVAADDSVKNKWGYYFIKHGSVTGNNYTFSPAPTTSGNIIEATNASNYDTANSYDLVIGARVDSTMKIGSYAGTYVVQLVSNAIPYVINFKDSVVSSMPMDINTVAPSETVILPSDVPSRNGYTFTGWCTVQPANTVGIDTCSGGTVYQAGDDFNINQIADNNNYDLYAMWSLNTPVNDNIYMQNVDVWGASLGLNQEVTAVDIRDGKTYTVARLCMATNYNNGANDCSTSTLWMTQNLDLVLGDTGVRTLTSNDSDINTDLGAAMGYTTSNGIITWTPAGGSMGTPAVLNSGTPEDGNNDSFVTGWTNSDTIPYQAEGGTRYVFTSGSNSNDTKFGTRLECIAAGHTDAECNHYHIGNYYNWTAAVASNDTSTWGNDYIGMPYYDAANSICPKGWRLLEGLSGSDSSVDSNLTEFNRLALAYGITTGRTTNTPGSPASSSEGMWQIVVWATNGFNNFRTNPLYFVRSGNVNGSALRNYATNGYLWSSTARSGSIAFYLDFNSGGLFPASQFSRYDGFPVRCVLR